MNVVHRGISFYDMTDLCRTHLRMNRDVLSRRPNLKQMFRNNVPNGLCTDTLLDITVKATFLFLLLFWNVMAYFQIFCVLKADLE